MAPEEKLMMRFQKERAKMHKKSSLFQLGDEDDEELTHGGMVRESKWFHSFFLMFHPPFAPCKYTQLHTPTHTH